MAKMRFGQKADRVVKLLVGLKDHTAATALSAYGFTEADLKEGWDLLKDAAQVNLDRAPSGTGDVLDQLDAPLLVRVAPNQPLLLQKRQMLVDGSVGRVRTSYKNQPQLC